MNIIKVTLITAGLGLALGVSTPADAVGRYITSNAVDKCQAFTPGVTNTIRNRVVGAENVGAGPIAVACVFELNEIAGAGSVDVSNVQLYFVNGGGAPTTVTCTLLTGNSNGPGPSVGGAQTLTTASMAAAGGTGNVAFGGVGGVFGVGVNCNLPSSVTIAATLIQYVDGGSDG